MKKIGFIGVGIMGRSMVRNLMKMAMSCTSMPVIRKRWQMWSRRAPTSMIRSHPA